jgi:nitrogen fixation/metabolism regulation signal transduction histidine kinase
MRPVYEQALAKPTGSAQAQVNMRVESQERSFVVRVTTERSSEDEHGFVVTFDDITELVAAQRNSAWADIARRIAHEIKNPLTPIQLSAERLKRKYGKEITTDPQVFEQCTETIIRQVGDIGRMVDEFSAFARMPSAALEPHDLSQIVKEALVLQRVSDSDLELHLDLPDSPLILPIDRRLVTQAVTNLVKNAKEAIEARPQRRRRAAGAHRGEGRQASDEAAIVEVVDNGIGLPRAGPRAAHRALHDDAREGHRPRPRHRQADHGRARRRHRADGRTGVLRRRAGGRWCGSLSNERRILAGDNTGPAGDANGAQEVSGGEAWQPIFSSSTTRPIFASSSPAFSRTRASRRA